MPGFGPTGSGPIGSAGEETTSVTYELMRVETIESVQATADGRQFAVWFTTTDGERYCLVLPNFKLMMPDAEKPTVVN